MGPHFLRRLIPEAWWCRRQAGSESSIVWLHVATLVGSVWWGGPGQLGAKLRRRRRLRVGHRGVTTHRGAFAEKMSTRLVCSVLTGHAEICSGILPSPAFSADHVINSSSICTSSCRLRTWAPATRSRRRSCHPVTAPHYSPAAPVGLPLRFAPARSIGGTQRSAAFPTASRFR